MNSFFYKQRAAACAAIASLLTTTAAQALMPCCEHTRPDAHAPAGVMGDHAHKKGEWMVSYRFMYMYMEGNRDGTTELSDADVTLMPPGSFVVAPTAMEMQMHMLGIMYAPTERMTLMAMFNYQNIRMDHVIGQTNMNPSAPARIQGLAGSTFTTRAHGYGDTPVSAIITLREWEQSALLLNLGISLPTGSIDEMDFTPLPAASVKVLPYPMQLGSGTFDLLPGLTYIWQRERISGGAQAKGTIRLGENDADYSLGDRFASTAWVSWLATKNFSTSARIDWQAWGDIDGADSRIITNAPFAPNPPTIATAQTDLRSGQRVDLHWGVNWVTDKGPGKNQRLAAEFGVPVYQNLDGPQLETDLLLTLGWQMAF